jgi:SAM-dependent methyltransferase
MIDEAQQNLPETGRGDSNEIYLKPRFVDRLEDCIFYHTTKLPGFGEVRGQWDLRGRVHNYIGKVDVAGKRVLDVGAASGFISFSMEQLGAQVVSFDADNASRIAFLPFRNSLFTTNHAQWEVETNEFLQKLHNSYWLTHRLYGSQAQVFHGDVYNLPEALGQFDVVVVGQILVHLRDPITALASIAKRCRGLLVITEDMIKTEETTAKLTASPDTGPDWLWWHYSIGTFKFLMKILGFEVLSLTTNRYVCHHEYLPGEIPIDTLVARRLP